MQFTQFSFSEQPKKTAKKVLPAGNYEFKILRIEESQMTGPKIGTVPVARLTLDIEGVTAKRIDVVLSEYKMYKHILASFLRSVNALDENGECYLDSFEDLVGSIGKAHVEPKRLTGGGTVYNVTEWLKNDNPTYYVNQPKEEKPTKVLEAIDPAEVFVEPIQYNEADEIAEELMAEYTPENDPFFLEE